MITGISAIANGGYLMEPHIVKELVDQNGVVQKAYDPWSGAR
jgi:cell division protein FtsI/penicillin-binding protein 2